MTKTFKLPPGEPLLNIASYARRGPGERDGRLTPEQIEHIRRTVRRDPEVMVKVLSRGAGDFKAVVKHLDYISRRGKVELETDDGDRLKGKPSSGLLNDWDLDVDELRRQGDLKPSGGRPAPKLVHKLMFSMPAGTPPDKVLAAVRTFAREEFWGKHRYAMALHTDEPHPHVHLVVKAMSEHGERLNIRKATLREWRREFARYLRDQGIAANATERAVRAEIRAHKKDGIYRAAQRGDSSQVRARVETVANELLTGDLRVEPGKGALIETRRLVERGWRSTIHILQTQGHRDLAANARRFVEQISPPMTEKEQLANALLQSGRRARVLNQPPPTR
jgi:hypothetical protein